jgi:hypothetical protein
MDAYIHASRTATRKPGIWVQRPSPRLQQGVAIPWHIYIYAMYPARLPEPRNRVREAGFEPRRLDDLDTRRLLSPSLSTFALQFPAQNG